VFQHITEAIGGHTNNINIYPGVPKHQRNYRTHKQHQYTLVFQNITEAIGGHTNNINIYPGVPKHQRDNRTQTTSIYPGVPKHHRGYRRTHKQHQSGYIDVVLCVL
jgi:hypothetical protein